MGVTAAPEKPRVAYVMTPITFGGSEKVSLNFLKNVNSDVVAIDPILFLRPWESETIFEGELRRQGICFTPVPVAKYERFDLFRIVRCFWHLKKALQRHSYDLIHTHGYLADILGFLASRSLKIPIISTCHGFINENCKLAFYNHLDRMVLRRFTKIISVSKSIRDELIHKGVGGDLITVVENCPETNHPERDHLTSRNSIRTENNFGPQELVLGYVGRLSSEKGISYLIEAIALPECRALPVKLLVIGEGPQRAALETLAKSLDVADRVVFTGFQNNIDEWLTALDILVLPSLTEGSPMVLLEAMYRGLPCIASAVGGIPGIIKSGVDGILVAPGEPGEICAAVCSLSADAEKRSSLSGNAKQKIALEYNITDWSAKITGEYSDILQTAGGHR